MSNGIEAFVRVSNGAQRSHDPKVAELSQRIAERVIEQWNVLNSQMMDVAEVSVEDALNYQRQELARIIAGVIRE